MRRRNTITSLAGFGRDTLTNLKKNASMKIENIKEKRRNRGSIVDFNDMESPFEDEKMPPM